jgi:hypothetical protein
MRRCVGAVVIGFPRWRTPKEHLVGEYNHYEGAVALTLGLPVFLLVERGVENRGVIDSGGGKGITYIPQDADLAWVETEEFSKRFNSWKRENSVPKRCVSRVL